MADKSEISKQFSESRPGKYLRDIHLSLGISEDFIRNISLELHPEAEELIFAGINPLNRFRQQLLPEALRAWTEMKDNAGGQGIILEILSGFRSYRTQADIIQRKLASGMVLKEILTVIAVPGYSEHHSGRAIDIGTPGIEPVTEVFEKTEAFSWLVQNAAQHGFRLSYPRNNDQGIIYEPWHWFWTGGTDKFPEIQDTDPRKKTST